MMDAEPKSTPVLLLTLEAAVPLWIHQVRGWPPALREQKARECGQVIAEKGDVLQYGGGKKGETANAFNKLALGLALMSFYPGGVKFAGLHWETV